MSLIPIDGIPDSMRLPGTYLQINFNQGPSTASAGPRDVCYVMPMLSTGTWQVNQLVQVKNESDAITGAGSGSPAHIAVRTHLSANKGNKIFVLPYAASSGGAVKADGYIQISGTATGQGILDVVIDGTELTIAINSGDTPTVIGDALANSVNAQTFLPCTGADVTGKVTLTAKIAGKSQGDGTTGVIRFRASVTSGIGVTLVTSGSALGLGSGTDGSDGSTTEVANLTTALATINAVRKYYLVFSVWDSASLAVIKTHLANKSAPNPGLRSVGISAYTGTLSSGITLATTLNYERMQIAWMKNSENTVAELAANLAAIRQKQESVDASYNFDSYSAADWLILPVYATSDRPDDQDLNDAITGGLTPIASSDTGSYIVTSSTTRTKDSTGLVQDWRSSESHRISVSDEVGDTLLVRSQNTYGGFKLKDDARNADNTINFAQKLNPKVVTPYRYGKFIASILDEFGDAPIGNDHLQDVASSKASINTDIDPGNSGRLEAGFDIHVIDLLHQVTVRIAEVSQG